MQPIQVSTIILGGWNPRIFTPLWLKKHLFEIDSNDPIEGLVNFDELAFGFKRDDITIFPKPNSLEINFEGYNPELAIKTSSIISKVIELLPHTPIGGLGVNIRYSIDKTENLKFIKLVNNLNVKFLDFDLNQIKQTVNKGEYQINIITDINATSVLTNFNFHYSKISHFDLELINKHYLETQTILS